MKTLLAIDAGTTSTRALAFDLIGTIIGESQREFTQIYPQPGWVEHGAEEIWGATVSVCRNASAAAGIEAASIAGIGISNQRETTVI